MRLRTAKRAHELINKRNEIKKKTTVLLMALTEPYSLAADFIDKNHAAKLCAYYATLLDKEMGEVDYKIQKLR